jgi:two-component system CheB/CheR fusion protein
LRKNALPALFHNRDPSDAIRIWVPGCATGEEAYTIAILILEEASRIDARPQIQIFGSDLDTRALAVAREGRYPTSIEADVSEERLRRFFNRDNDGYHVRQELRDRVLFAVHDLLKDPPFSRVDLVSCRNVLIYLDRDLQEQVCSTFHYALNPGGFLLLGSSETADHPPGIFRVIDRTARLYQARTQPGDKQRLLPRLLGPVAMRDQIGAIARGVPPSTALNEATMHRRALEKIAPPSILVDAGRRAVHLSDTAGRFLQPSGGPLTGDIADLVRPELRFEMRSALDRVFEQNEDSVTSLPIPVRFNGSVHGVLLHIKAAERDETDPRTALVMFIESGPVLETAAGAVPASDETVRRLSLELDLTQSRLRTVREESEATNEELRAANEELQSINEEHRSTSEELETSKEELQSINEELQTVNSELKLKLEAISRAHSDLQNLMAATDFGTLFLDSNLRIKRFTDRVTELFSIAQSDEGRPITDFAHQLEYDDLVKDARAVIADLAPIRRELRSRSGRWYDVRLRPYRTVEDRIDGVVITFVDVSDRRTVDLALRETERQLGRERRLVELSRSPIFVWDFDGGIVDWNHGCVELYGYTREEALGKRKEELLKTVVPGSSFAELRRTLLEKGSWSGELRQTTRDGRQLTVESAIELSLMDGQRLVLESTRDVTEARRWQERQHLLFGELSHRMKNTLAVVQAIAQQTQRNSASPGDFMEAFSGRLAALGNAHSLLTQSDWNGADFAALAHAQLDAYAADSPDRIRLEGPRVVLPADIATPFGLVLHELATNAVKYGALSAQKGSVSLKWSLAGGNQPVLSVIWQERGGPQAKAPAGRSFGSSLIERGIPDAKVTREFRPEGLLCTIEVPLANEASRVAGDRS